MSQGSLLVHNLDWHRPLRDSLNEIMRAATLETEAAQTSKQDYNTERNATVHFLAEVSTARLAEEFSRDATLVMALQDMLAKHKQAIVSRVVRQAYPGNEDVEARRVIPSHAR